MKLAVFILMTLLVSSCSTNPFFREDERIAKLKAAKILSVQNEIPVPSEFSTHKITEDIQKLSPLPVFAKSICNGVVNEQCRAKFNQMAFARFKEAYPLADSSKIATHCQARPIECKKMQYIEERFIISQAEEYNFKARAANEASAKEIDSLIAMIEEQNRAAEADSWRGLANALNENEREQNSLKQQNQPINTYCQPNGRGTWCQTR